MIFSLSAPSKTFLLGEYVALNGGPTLVLTTQPRFKLSVKNTNSATPVIFEGINKESPAGKFILHYAEQFKGYQLIFNDPHHGLGGFGASSAQYLLVALLKQIIVQSEKTLGIDCPVEKILTEYQHYAWDGTGIAPSGADVVAQIQGDISYFHKAKSKWLSLKWPFDDLNYYLIRTGHKLATHQHLKEVPNLANHRLENIVFSGLQHLQTKNKAGFIQAINDYATELQKQNLVAEQTKKLLSLIHSRPEILAAKGCGAMGADVILLLAENKNHANLFDWLEANNFDVVHFGSEVSSGVQMKRGVNLIP